MSNCNCQKAKAFPQHPVYLSQDEALPHVKGGDKVGIGYPLAHNVYRISEGKDKDGNPQKTFNFQYHY